MGLRAALGTVRVRERLLASYALRPLYFRRSSRCSLGSRLDGTGELLWVRLLVPTGLDLLPQFVASARFTLILVMATCAVKCFTERGWL
jgi:hypothetical protein